MIESKYICDHCKERLGFVDWPGHVMIRPIRFSKCRHYNGAGTSDATCRGIGENVDGAVMAFEHLTVVELSGECHPPG